MKIIKSLDNEDMIEILKPFRIVRAERWGQHAVKKKRILIYYLTLKIIIIIIIIIMIMIIIVVIVLVVIILIITITRYMYMYRERDMYM